MSALEQRILADVSRETLRDLELFAEKLRAYTSHTNLVAPSTIPCLWKRHILDSAQLVLLKPYARKWLDLGSGGGLPGIVTAILMKDKVDAHVDLVESTAKKVLFLQQMIDILALPATVHQARIEAVAEQLDLPQMVSARALAPLPKLLDWAAPWLSNGATGLFHKGRGFRSEIEESCARWSFHVIEHPSLTDSGSAILEIHDLTPRKTSRKLR